MTDYRNILTKGPHGFWAVQFYLDLTYVSSKHRYDFGPALIGVNSALAIIVFE